MATTQAPPRPIMQGSGRMRRFRPAFRGREFLLLLFPVALTFAGFYALEMLRAQGLPTLSERFWPAYVLAGGALIMHVALSLFAPRTDQHLLPIALTMNGMGLIMIERLASNFTVRQTVTMGIGMALCLLFALWRDWPRLADRYRYSLLLPGVLLLMLGVIVSFVGEGPGRSVLNITERLGIQPSEPLKVMLVLFLASFLDFHREKFVTVRLTRPFAERRWLWVFVPLLGMWGISMLLLVLQRDLGAALLFFAIFLVLAYLATQRADYTVLGLGLFLAGAFVAYQAFGYVADRVALWLDPWAQRDSQIVQSLIAVANGGLIGQGIGQGFPDFVYVVHSDFILAAIGEEWGLVGILGVIALYLFFVLFGFLVAIRADDSYEQLVAGGLTALIALQALIVMGGVLKLVPMTGMTLPFIAYGGSSLVTCYIALGMLLRLSQEAERT